MFDKVKHRHTVILEAIAKSMMKMRESKSVNDLKQGGIFQELFNHPDYVSLDKSKQTALGLEWAYEQYQRETDNSFIESFFTKKDLKKFAQDSIMLDIGCYLGGKTVRWLEQYGGHEIYGIDIDPRFINVATSFAKHRSAHAHFSVSHAESLDFPDESFDLIFSENTLEHVWDIKKVLGECKRVLKKNGRMIVVFPSFWGPFSHHLDLVTQMPFIHWLFDYPVILRAYFSILEDRGEDARWYCRKDKHPLPFEKGYSINGTGAQSFRTMISRDWDIVADGFTHRRNNTNSIEHILKCGIKKIQPTISRELCTIAYILKKR
ncbi:MAG: class I SAM-dependent methyltransferase [Desulfobacteraceae bacterium]|nr:class I SAM-dependent methyltransferase [Desulfobacteraceae bacterium]